MKSLIVLSNVKFTNIFLIRDMNSMHFNKYFSFSVSGLRSKQEPKTRSFGPELQCLKDFWRFLFPHLPFYADIADSFCINFVVNLRKLLSCKHFGLQSLHFVRTNLANIMCVSLESAWIHKVMMEIFLLFFFFSAITEGVYWCSNVIHCKSNVLGDNPFKMRNLSCPNPIVLSLQISSRPSQIFNMGSNSRVGQCAPVFKCLLTQIKMM